MEQRAAQLLREQQQHRRLVQSLRHALEEHVEDVHRERAQREATEDQTRALRALVAELLDEASRWRAESEDQWVSRVRDLVVEASAAWRTPVSVPRLASAAARTNSAADRGAGTFAKRTGGGQQADELADEIDLLQSIESLRSENVRLAADAAKGGRKTTGDNRTACLQGARRRVLECARRAQLLDRANAELRCRLENKVRHRQCLEASLLARKRRPCSSGRGAILRPSVEQRLGDRRLEQSRSCDLRAAAERCRAEVERARRSCDQGLGGTTEGHLLSPPERQRQALDPLTSGSSAGDGVAFCEVSPSTSGGFDLQELEDLVARTEASLEEAGEVRVGASHLSALET